MEYVVLELTTNINEPVITTELGFVEGYGPCQTIELPVWFELLGQVKTSLTSVRQDAMPEVPFIEPTIEE